MISFTKLAFSCMIMVFLTIVVTALMSFTGIDSYLYLPYLFVIGLLLWFFTIL